MYFLFNFNDGLPKVRMAERPLSEIQALFSSILGGRNFAHRTFAHDWHIIDA